MKTCLLKNSKITFILIKSIHIKYVSLWLRIKTMFSMIKEFQTHYRNLRKYTMLEGKTRIIDISSTKRQPCKQFE